MRELPHILLFEPGSATSLSSHDRELIAACVSSRNTSYFCQQARCGGCLPPGGSPELVAAVWAAQWVAQTPDKLRRLLGIAGCVRVDAKTVTPELVQEARDQGATDLEIHDTILIAVACSMYNRDVDGLATWQPRNEELYRITSQQLARQEYVREIAEP